MVRGSRRPERINKNVPFIVCLLYCHGDESPCPLCVDYWLRAPFAYSFRARGVEGDEGVHAEEEEVGGGEVEGGGEEDGGEAGGAAGAEARPWRRKKMSW